MEELFRSITEKISSYNIFNNLFPGVVFCYLIDKITRFSFTFNNIWECLFVYYFVGMIISRIGSIFVEKVLKSVKVKNNEPLLNFAPYDQYVEASKNDAFLRILSETNNMYRTIIAMIVLVIVVKFYDGFIYDYVKLLGKFGNNLAFVIVCLIITFLFVYSYKKQTNFIRVRVERYNSLKEKDDKRREPK